MIILHEDTNTVLTEQDLIDIYMEGYNEGIQAVEESMGKGALIGAGIGAGAGYLRHKLAQKEHEKRKKLMPKEWRGLADHDFERQVGGKKSNIIRGAASGAVLGALYS